MSHARADLEMAVGQLERLANGWSAGQASAAESVARALAAQAQATGEGPFEPWDNALRFRMDLPGFYLSGMGEDVRCLLVGGSGRETTDALKQFWRADGAGVGHRPLVFCASSWAYEEAGNVIPAGCAARFSPDESLRLLRAEEPRILLKQLLRKCISRRRLSFYNICLPATGNAFFGRSRELSQLFENQTTNYAIAGPGRIGKTSLLKRHRWNLLRQRDPRSRRLFEIDFYSLSDTASDTVARHIAMSIRPSSQSSRVRACDLVSFFQQRRHELEGPLELLLDETDEVCDGEAFRFLAQAARNGHVRLVMAGRKGLYDYAVKNESSLGGRARPMLLEPLDVPEARELIRQPLGDLGIALREPNRVLEHILAQTGRLPHLIQFYCEQLVQVTVERGLDEVTLGVIESMEGRGSFSQYFLEPLSELRPALARALARKMLASTQSRFTTGEVVALAHTAEPDCSPEQARQACDGLVIENILTWDNGGYAIACHALRQFARKAGLLR